MVGHLPWRGPSIQTSKAVHLTGYRVSHGRWSQHFQVSAQNEQVRDGVVDALEVEVYNKRVWFRSLGAYLLGSHPQHSARGSRTVTCTDSNVFS